MPGAAVAGPALHRHLGGWCSPAGGDGVGADEFPPRAQTDLGLNYYLAATAPLESWSCLDWEQVSPEGIALLEGKTSIRNLTLHSFRKGPIPWKAVLSLRGLLHLSLSDTTITDAGMPRLTAFRELRYLYLRDTAITNGGLEPLTRLCNLRGLDLGRTNVTDLGMRHLGRIPTLRDLDLMTTPVGDPGLEHLRQLPRLEALQLNETRVTAEGLRHLAALRLKSWSIPRAIQGDVALENLLAAIEPPERLELLDWKLSDDGLEALGSASSLHWLAVGGAFTDDGLRHLAGLKRLAGLQLSSRNVSPAGIKHLRKLPALVSLGMGGQASDAHMGEIGRLPGITHLYLADTQVSDAGMKALAAAGPRKLESLSLRATGVGDDGLLALRTIGTLKSIDVGFTRITDKGRREFHKTLPACELYDEE